MLVKKHSEVNNARFKFAVIIIFLLITIIGSSIGLAIPKPIREGMKLKAGDKIRMLLRDNMICIQKVKQ
jgi:antitoxin component of MazEF toxin-antitoxin module